MAFSVVQHNVATSAAEATSLAVSLTNTVGSGNAVVVFGFTETAATLTVTDDKSVTYTQKDLVTDSVAGQTGASFVLGNITNGPKTFTLNYSGGSAVSAIFAVEVSGVVAASDPTDGHTGQNQASVGTGTDAITSGTFTTTTAAFVIGATNNTSGATTASVGTGFTSPAIDSSTGSGLFDADESKTLGASGSTAVTWTAASASNRWITLGMALQPVAAGTVPTFFSKPWAEPVRARPGLGAASHAFFAFDPLPIVPPTFAPLSEPVRFRQGLSAAQQQAFAWSSFTPAAEFIGPDKYMRALSEPQRRLLGLNPAQQQFFAADTAPIPTSNLFWFSPLSEPVRRPPALNAALQQFFAADTAVIPISKLFWFSPLSEPVRIRAALNAALQQFFATDTATIPITALMPWFGALSEPVRLAQGLRPWLQAFTAFDPSPFTPSLGWYERLSEPVRSLQGLSAARQAFEAFIFTPAPPNIFDNWYQPLSEPVRTKPGLVAALQQFFAIDPTLIINPAKIETWYQQLSEPQRNRIWLRAALQQAWTGPPRLIAIPGFTAVMNAIEMFDTMATGGVIFNVPASAETGVREMATPNATSPGVVSASTSVRVIT